MTGPANEYAARLDNHDRELGQAHQDRQRIWARLDNHGDRLTSVETNAASDRDDIQELKTEMKAGFTKLRTGQTKTIRWLIATTCTGVGLIFTGLAVTLAIIDRI